MDFFLLSQTMPDFDFLAKRCGITSLAGLKQAVSDLLLKIDLKQKQKDFEHLLFRQSQSEKILRFGDFVKGL